MDFWFHLLAYLPSRQKPAAVRKCSAAGQVTTLGRGGSDLTATIIGAALGLSEVQVWKDVDGKSLETPSESTSCNLPPFTILRASMCACLSERKLYRGLNYMADFVPIRLQSFPGRKLNSGIERKLMLLTSASEYAGG